MYFELLFIFILTTSQVEAQNSCNDECLTKTYCISSAGSGVCSENNLVTAQFKVIPVFGTYDYVQLTLSAYNVSSNDEKTIQVAIAPPLSLQNMYTCYKSSNGSTDARYDRGSYSLTTGSSSYEEGVLNCTWFFNVYDGIWPMGIDMFVDSSQSITLYDDSKEVLVAQNTSQLPIYHAQYLKCCNKVHGNDSFLLAFDQTQKHIFYRLYHWEYKNNEVAITLTRKDGIQLHFVHHYPNVEGYIIHGTKRISVDQQIIDPYGKQKGICKWVTPLILGDSTTSVDASNSVFDLQVDVDSIPVYTEKDVTLKN